MDPFVSFVVPCYNLAHLLTECIDSILAQKYRNFELLIMDNCSPDNTPHVAASFKDPRVKHIRNRINIGHVRNFNKGITMARGKYVWLVSADDRLRSPGALGRYVDLMERNPGVGYVFSRAIEVQGSKEVGLAEWTNCGEKVRVWNGRSFLSRLIQNNCIVMSSAMVRKECYDKVGLFPLDLPYACDWYLWSVLALHYQVGYLPEAMVSVRIHEQSLTTTFKQEGTPTCIVDELEVLWRVTHQAKLAGVISHRHAIHVAIASRTARALKPRTAAGTNQVFGQADFEALLRRYANDRKDEKDIRALLFMSGGDDQFWGGDYLNAAQAYWQGLKLRPWWMRIWAKYLLLWTGGLGVRVRRFYLAARRLSAGAR